MPAEAFVVFVFVEDDFDGGGGGEEGEEEEEESWEADGEGGEEHLDGDGK